MRVEIRIFVEIWKEQIKVSGEIEKKTKTKNKNVSGSYNKVISNPLSINPQESFRDSFRAGQ